MTPRTNPFRADRLAALPYIFGSGEDSETCWENLLSRLEKHRYRAAIIGPPGRGKSTLLDQFAPRLEERDWNVRRLKLDSKRRNFEKEIWQNLSSFNARDFILLDGAEQLSFWRWKFFIRRANCAGGVLITSHRTGLLPTLLECRSSPQLLQSLIVHLAPFMESEQPAQLLFEKHKGNLRDALRELYDLQL